MKPTPLLLLAPLLASACVIDPEALPEESVGTAEIRNSNTSASQYYRDRAVVLLRSNGVPFCTGTRIAANWVLTAMHCNFDPDEDQVGFYSSAPNYDTTRKTTVTQVVRQAGTNPSDCDTFTSGGCENTDGEFADMALLRLTDDKGDLDAEGPAATMAWKYPGQIVGTKVGAGQHNGGPNNAGLLRQVDDEIVSSNDGNGRFDTEDDDVDGGDSGGPFYYQNKVVGDLWGFVDFGFDDYNVYTSVPEHLPWILGQIGYRWQGLPVQTSKRYNGSTVDSFKADGEKVCQYACEKSTSCEAYNFAPSNDPLGLELDDCELKTGVTGTSTSSAWRGALRHGGRSGRSNDVVGYKRSDGIDSAVHRATNGRIHELWRTSSGYEWGDIHGSAPLAASDVSAYVRSDGINAVVYRSTTNRIIEIYLSSSGWQWADLSNAGGGEPAGDPVAYVRPDGINAVVYRGSNGYIYEIALGLGGWDARNLTTSAGLTSSPNAGDPSVLARADGYSSVVYTAGGQVYELYRLWSGEWSISSPSSLAGAPAAASRPYAYSHRDGITAIVYRSTGNRIIELWLAGSAWHYAQLSSSAVIGDPMAHLRTDTVESVLVRSSGSQILEIANAPWGTWNLSVNTGQTGLSATDASAYIRADGYNSVLFETSDNRIREMIWKPGVSWTWNDISVNSGETP